MIAKSFAFNFVNAYASLFYVAFFSSIFYNWSESENKKYFQCNTYMGETNPETGRLISDPDEGPNCMEAMNSMLGTIFCVRLILGNMAEVHNTTAARCWNHRGLHGRARRNHNRGHRRRRRHAAMPTSQPLPPTIRRWAALCGRTTAPSRRTRCLRRSVKS